MLELNCTVCLSSMIYYSCCTSSLTSLNTICTPRESFSAALFRSRKLRLFLVISLGVFFGTFWVTPSWTILVYFEVALLAWLFLSIYLLDDSVISSKLWTKYLTELFVSKTRLRTISAPIIILSLAKASSSSNSSILYLYPFSFLWKMIASLRSRKLSAE